jgi:hypothetical protein
MTSDGEKLRALRCDYGINLTLLKSFEGLRKEMKESFEEVWVCFGFSR